MLSICIAPTKRTQRGQLYEVRLGTSDGPVIVERSLDPEHAACRYLLKHGLKGRLEVWSEGRATPRMIIGCIESAAGKTARDHNQRGAILTKYQPMQADAEGEPIEGLTTEAGNDNGETPEADIAS